MPPSNKKARKQQASMAKETMAAITDYKDPFAEAIAMSDGEPYQFAIHAILQDNDEETFRVTSNIREAMKEHQKLLSTRRSSAALVEKTEINGVLTVMGQLPSTQRNPHPLVTWAAIRAGMTDGSDFLRPLAEASHSLVDDMAEVKGALDQELGKSATLDISKFVATRHWNSIIDQSIRWLDQLTTEARGTHKEVMQAIGHLTRDETTQEFRFDDPNVLKKLRGMFTQYVASRSAVELYQGLAELSRSKSELLGKKLGASSDAEVKRVDIETKAFKTGLQQADRHLEHDRETNLWLADCWDDWLDIVPEDAHKSVGEEDERVRDIEDRSNPLTWAIHADKCQTLNEFIEGIVPILKKKDPKWAVRERLEREARAAESGDSVTAKSLEPVTAESLEPAKPESTVPAESTPEKKRKKRKPKKKKTGTSTAVPSSETADESRVAETEEDDKSLVLSDEDGTEASRSAQVAMHQDPAILTIRQGPSQATSDVATKDITPVGGSNPVEEPQPEQSILDRLFKGLKASQSSSHGTSLPSHRDIQQQDPDSTAQETTLVHSEASPASGSRKHPKTTSETSRGGRTVYLPSTKPKETKGDSTQAATASSVGKYIPPHKWTDAKHQSAEQRETADVTTQGSASRGPTADWFPSRLAATTKTPHSGKRYHNDGIWSPLIDYPGGLTSWADVMDEEAPIG